MTTMTAPIDGRAEALQQAVAAQEEDSAAYRRAPYPAGLHPQVQPDRLATMARLAGLTPPDIRTARVLDVGTGSGMNLLALAAAWPEARFVGIDIVEDAIEQGRAWARAAGLTNVEFQVGDLLDPQAVDGTFDYITAHGVFAWVPAPVADALLALVRRHLSPDGVAMISYNALPGGYIRYALRDRMLLAAGDATDPTERLARARAALKVLADDKEGDPPARAAFRSHARQTLDGRDNVLLHDEMGGSFRPRYQADALREAAAHGLKFLSDANAGNLADGFLPRGADLEGDHDAQVVAHACERDWIDFQFFHSTMFVHAEAPVRRTLNVDVLNDLYVSSRAEEEQPGMFATAGGKAAIQDDGLRGVMQRLIAEWPKRLRIGDLNLDVPHLKAIFGLFDAGLLTIASQPEPYLTKVGGARPVASPTALLAIREDMPWVPTLDHRMIRLDEGARSVLGALDGSGDEVALQAAARAIGFADEAQLQAGLQMLAYQAVLVR
jgi:SAM-dependent methyltransferase